MSYCNAVFSRARSKWCGKWLKGFACLPACEGSLTVSASSLEIEEQKCHSSPQIPPQLSASWLTPHLTLCLPQDSRLVAGAVIRPRWVCESILSWRRLKKCPQAELCHTSFVDLKQNGLSRKYNHFGDFGRENRDRTSSFCELEKHAEIE